MIIGLAGEKGSGKDTVAAYLVKQYQFERRAFADPLKKSVAALLDIPFFQIDKFKNDDTVKVSVHHDEDGYLRNIKSQTFREFLQKFGTESHRDVFGVDFWVDQTLPKDGYYHGRKIVITDCRFDNEVERIRHLGGKIVRIHRRGIEPGIDSHQSERFDFIADYDIFNDDTLDDLWTATEEILTWIGEEEMMI